MNEVFQLIITFMGLVSNLIVGLIHNEKFISRYKNYKISFNKKIIIKYGDKLRDIIKSKDAIRYQEEIENIIDEIRAENKPLRILNETNEYLKWAIILLAISFIGNLIYIFKIWEWQSLDDIILGTLIFGVFYTILAIYNAFLLSRKISEYELDN